MVVDTGLLQGEVNVTQADRDCVADIRRCLLPETADQIVARHRQAALTEADALIAQMRGALEQAQHTLMGAAIGKYEVDFVPTMNVCSTTLAAADDYMKGRK